MRALWGGLAVLALAGVFGILVAARLPAPPPSDPNATSLADVLSRTIAADGVDAAAALYRGLRERGFPGMLENEVATNRLGYELLRKGDLAGAVRVFELNAETHPGSANVHDSLGEAYLAAGDRTAAIASYEKAVAISPRMKSAAAALKTLANREREPFPPLLLFHVGAGVIGLLSGVAAASLRKGSRRHGLAGDVFVVAMLCMSSTGAYLASRPPEPSPISVMMGVLTFYLVSTAWWTARRREPGIRPFDWVALLVVSFVAASLLACGWSAARSASGTLGDGIPAAIYFVFGGVASLAAVLDLRRITKGGVSGAPRIARHLWRMCTALFVAATSFFQGQPQVFPDAVRESGILVAPGILVLLFMLFWLVRVLFTRRHARAVPARPKIAGDPATT